MAFYNVWSRPFIQRSSALGFLTVGMGAGAAALILIGSLTGSVTALSSFGAPQWIAGAYLGIGGGALAFILWVMALERATPTRVASTMTVNPIAAGLLANWLIGEPSARRVTISFRSRRGPSSPIARCRCERHTAAIASISIMSPDEFQLRGADTGGEPTPIAFFGFSVPA